MVNKRMDPATERFAKRFEAQDYGYLFRDNLRADPLKVTAVERDGFVAAFTRAYRRLWLGYLAAVFALLIFLPLIHKVSGDAIKVVFFVALVLPTLGLLLYLRWLFGAPGRAMAGRLPVAAGYSLEEARRRSVADVKLGSMALGVIILPLLVWYETKGHPFQRGNWVETAILGGVAVFAFVQIIRKLLYGRKG